MASQDDYSRERVFDQGLAFRFQNMDIPTVSEHGMEVRFVEAFGRLDIMIWIKPETTIAAIRKSWRWIRTWRERITNWNQVPESDDAYWLIFYYEQLQSERKISYSKIAKELNMRISNHLRHHLEIETSKRLTGGHLEDIEAQLKWATDILKRNDGHKFFSLFYAGRLMEIMGMDIEDINIWLQDGLDTLKDDKKPFPTDDVPIDGERVRNMIRKFRSR